MDTTTTYNANVELWKQQRVHLTWEVPVRLQVKLPVEQQTHLKWEVQFKMSVEATLRHLKLEVQVPIKLRLTRESRLQFTWELRITKHSCERFTWELQVKKHSSVDQDMVDAETDHDIADVAVVEHPNPHEDGEYAECEHPVKGHVDEDDGTILDPVQVKVGVEREMAFMGELGVGEPCDRPRWCYRRKGVAVRSRLVARQFPEGTDPSVHGGTPGPAAARILLTLSAIYSLFAATADFGVAFMRTPMTEEVFVERPAEANLPRGKV